MKKGKKSIAMMLLAALLVMGGTKSVSAIAGFWNPYQVWPPAYWSDTTLLRHRNTKSKTAYNDNYTAGNTSKKLYSCVRDMNGYNITDFDSFSHGGWARMTYKNPNSGYGQDVRMYVESTTYVKVYADGRWTPDE